MASSEAAPPASAAARRQRSRAAGSMPSATHVSTVAIDAAAKAAKTGFCASAMISAEVRRVRAVRPEDRDDDLADDDEADADHVGVAQRLGLVEQAGRRRSPA